MHIFINLTVSNQLDPFCKNLNRIFNINWRNFRFRQSSKMVTSSRSIQRRGEKRKRLISSHLDWTSLVNKGLIILRKEFASSRIKNDFRDPRDARKKLHNKPTRPVYVFFGLMSPSTPSPTLTKYSDLCKSANTKREIPSGQDGLILPSWIANQNTGFASYCPQALPAMS